MAVRLKPYDPVGRNAYDQSVAGPNCRALIVRQGLKTPVRPQFGAKSYDRSGQNAYDGKSAAHKIHALIVGVASLFPTIRATSSQIRPQRGNLAAKYGASSANCPKPLRRQIGSLYDQKKIGNNYDRSPA